MKQGKRITKRRERRTFRVRNRVRRDSAGRPRLAVFRSNKQIYVQLIDDEARRTLVSANSTEQGLLGAGEHGGNKAAAAKVGKAVAERALEKGIKQITFDRGPYRYHGRIEALADSAREAGLVF